MCKTILSNPTLLLPLIGALAVLIIAIIRFWKLQNTETPQKVSLFGIWLAGIIAFLLGVLAYFIAMKNAMNVISMAGDISPAIVAEGIKSSYNSIIAGLLILIISIILWGIAKGIKEKKTKIL